MTQSAINVAYTSFNMKIIVTTEICFIYPIKLFSGDLKNSSLFWTIFIFIHSTLFCRISAFYELAPGSEIKRSQIYADYIESCKELGRKGVLNAQSFFKILGYAFVIASNYSFLSLSSSSSIIIIIIINHHHHHHAYHHHHHAYHHHYYYF